MPKPRNFHDIAAQEGWTPETQVAVLLGYIENQQSDEAFDDYLEGQIAEDELEDEDDPDPDYDDDGNLRPGVDNV